MRAAKYGGPFACLPQIDMPQVVAPGMIYVVLIIGTGIGCRMLLGSRLIKLLLISLAVFLFSDASGIPHASAHAELKTASPPAGGTVTTLPASLTLIFSEEVKPGGVTVRVTGPSGERVDTGDAAVDLTDAERTRVNVSLYAGGAGAYTVSWETISNIDADQTSGSYEFTVSGLTASPAPANVGTPDALAGEITPEVSATLEDFTYGNPLGTSENYDSRAFAISVGAGLLALLAIVGFWFFVRPTDARFGSRSRRGRK